MRSRQQLLVLENGLFEINTDPANNSVDNSIHQTNSANLAP